MYKCDGNFVFMSTKARNQPDGPPCTTYYDQKARNDILIQTGTSDVYRGDSSINVFGDLLSCAMGYNLAR